MPRYFFSVIGIESCPDFVGCNLPDEKAARHEALKFADSLVAEESMRLSLGPEWAIQVTDRDARVVLRLDFKGDS